MCNMESVEELIKRDMEAYGSSFSPEFVAALERREERIKRELLEGLKAKAISQRQMVEVKQMGGLGAEYIESRIKVIPIDAIEQQLKTLDGQENTNV